MGLLGGGNEVSEKRIGNVPLIQMEGEDFWSLTCTAGGKTKFHVFSFTHMIAEWAECQNTPVGSTGSHTSSHVNSAHVTISHSPSLASYVNFILEARVISHIFFTDIQKD